MNKFLIFFILFFSSNIFSSVREITIYSDNSYYPYSYTDEHGHATGIYTDIILKAMEKIPEYKLKIVPIPWKRALNALENKSVMAIYPPYYRPHTRLYVGEYSEPLLSENIIAVSRKTKSPKTRKRWPTDWLDQRIGIFLGTLDITGPELVAAVEKHKVEVIESIGNEENLIKLARGEIDVYVNDRLAIYHTLNKLKKEKRWLDSFPEIEEVAQVSKEEGYLAFSKSSKNYPYQKDFLNKFNQAIRQLKKENKIKALSESYN